MKIKIFRHFIRPLLYFLLTFFALLIISVVLLTVDPLKSTVSDQLKIKINESLAENNLSIQMSQPLQWSLNSLQIQHLSVFDKNDQWLQLDELRLHWDWSDLFERRFLIQEVYLKKIALLKKPELKSNQAIDQPPLENHSELVLPIGISIDKLFIEKVFIAKQLVEDLNLTPVKNKSVKDIEFSVSANAIINQPDDFSINLIVDNSQAVNAQIKLSALENTLNFSNNIILKKDLYDWIDFSKNDLPLPQTIGDTEITLTAAGTKEKWSARLLLDSKNISKLSSDFDYAQKLLNTRSELNLYEDLRKVNQWPDELEKFLFSSRLDIVDDVIHVNALNLENTFGRLTMSGLIDMQQQKLDLKPQLEINQTLIKSRLDPPMTFAAIKPLAMHLQGNWHHPRIKLNWQLSELSFQDFSISQIKLESDFKLNKTADKFPQWELNTHLDVEQLNNEMVFNQDIQSRITLFSQNNRIQSTTEISGEQFTIQSQGEFNLNDRSGSFTMDSNQIQFDQLIPNTLLSSAQINSTIDIKPDFKQIDIRPILDIQLNSQEKELAEALGSRLKLDSAISLENLQWLQVRNLSLTSLTQNLSANGSYDIKSKDINFQIKHQYPQLEPLAAIVNQAISGKLNQTLDIDGTIEKLRIKHSGELYSMNLGENKLDEIHLDSLLTLSDIIEGQSRLMIKNQGQQLSLDTPFSFQDNLLELSKINLLAEDNTIDGKLSFNNELKTLTGQLTAQLKNLSRLKFITQNPQLDGSLDAKIIFNENNQKRQKLDITAHSELLSPTMGLQLNNVNLNAQLSQQENWQIDSQISVDTLKQDNNNLLSSLSLTAKGSNNQLDIVLQANQLAQLANTTLQAEYQTDNDNQQLRLSKFNSSFLSKPLSLQKPVSIDFQTNHLLNVSDVLLHWDNTVLSAKANLNKDKILGELKIEQLGLDHLKQLKTQSPYLSELQGILGITANVEGSLTNPSLKSQLKINKLKLNTAEMNQFPELQVNSTIDYTEQNMNANLSLSGLSDKPIEIQLNSHIPLSLKPFLVDFSDQTAMQGSIKADMQLENFQQWLALEQQQFAGHLVMDMNFSGSLKKPQLSGYTRIEKGLYENSISANYFKDIQLSLKAKQQQLLLEKLQIHDHKQGVINASGQYQINSEGPFLAEIIMDKMQLIADDKKQVNVNGKLKLNGNHQQAKIFGDIQIYDGYFYLPDQLPVDIPELELTERNQQAETKTAEKVERSNFPVELDLLINISPHFYVRGHGLESSWTGDLSIADKITNPQIKGQMSVKRGYFNALSNRFDFDRGSINFYGDFPPTPQLNFLLSANAGDYKALLTISGAAKKPDISLSSDPALPQDEVLAQLLFKKDIKDISALQAIKLADTIRQLSTGNIGLADSGRNTLGIDTLDITEDASGKGAAIVAGKQISDNIFVEVENSLSDSGTKVKVEMEMTEQISVESSVDQSSNTGFGVNWKINY